MFWATNLLINFSDVFVCVLAYYVASHKIFTTTTCILWINKEMTVMKL